MFRFKHFSLSHSRSAFKIGTDAVVLGAAMSISPDDTTALDIGTGSGIIALMAAQRSGNLKIYAIDIDSASAEEAAENFARSPWAARLVALHSPLSGFGEGLGFDLIFSNPPYYDNSLQNPDARTTAARHTVNLSYREILAFASEHLNPGGRVSMILPCDCLKGLERTAASFGFRPYRVLSVMTGAGKAPKRAVTEFSKEARGVVKESITLTINGKRSEEYKKLTENFYL